MRKFTCESYIKELVLQSTWSNTVSFEEIWDGGLVAITDLGTFRDEDGEFEITDLDENRYAKYSVTVEA